MSHYFVWHDYKEISAMIIGHIIFDTIRTSWIIWTFLSYNGGNFVKTIHSLFFLSIVRESDLSTHPPSCVLTTTILTDHSPRHCTLRRRHWPPPSSLSFQIRSELKLTTTTTCSSPSRWWRRCPFFFRSGPPKSSPPYLRPLLPFSSTLLPCTPMFLFSAKSLQIRTV